MPPTATKIHVTPHARRPRRWLPLVLLASVALHLGLFLATRYWQRVRPRLHGSSLVEVKVRRAPEPPEPEPPPEPKPPPPEPRPRPPRRVHKPNTEPPPAPPEVDPKPTAPPVFGVTADSVTNGESGVAVRRGNTLAKKMERKLPAPTWASGPPAAPPPPPRKAAPPRPVPSYKLTQAPSFAHKVEPAYPEAARQSGVHGTVLLEVLIDAAGKVRSVRVLRSPDERLSRAAVDAIRKSRMNPGRVGSRAVPVKLKIPFRFVLDS